FAYLLSATDPDIGYPADDNRLVQQWLWYSLNDTNYENSGKTWSALFDPETHEILEMGRVFANALAALRRPYVDLVPAYVEFDADQPVYFGDSRPLTATAVIRNLGNEPVVQPFEVQVYEERTTSKGSTSTLLTSQVIVGLPARHEGEAQVALQWIPPADNDWRLRVVVDPTDVVLEARENNNELERSPRVDLGITNLAVTPGERIVVGPNATVPLTFTARVENLGDLGVRGATVRFWEQASESTRYLLGEQLLSDLPAKGVRDITFVWGDADVGRHTVVAVVESPAGLQDDLALNNELQQQVTLASSRVYLPLLERKPLSFQCTEQVTNGSFETGDLSGWSLQQGIDIFNQSCFRGSFCAKLGSFYNAHDRLAQTVQVPADATAATLRFAYAVVSQDPSSQPHDTLRAVLRQPDGQEVARLMTISNADQTGYWGEFMLDVTERAGQTLQLYFEAENDSQLLTWFFVDEVSLQTCRPE
ncbi:MAG TPA: hypothetical protein EYP04_02585, partial [Anaerolineae bacterium]|nr:hypothetical protein [Anaerolineae bacterium]